MGTCRHPVRSLQTTRTCRECDGAGEIETRPYLWPSPYDTATRCESCDGAGYVRVTVPDVLERIQFARSFPDRESFGYSRLRREASRRAPLPGVAA